MRPPSPKERAILDRLTGPATPAEVATLRLAVAAHLGALRQAATQDELLPIDLAETLARRLDALLSSFSSLLPAHHPQIIGAARYFVSDADAIPDTSGVLGLDDDVAVFNAVARAIGRPDLEIVE